MCQFFMGFYLKDVQKSLLTKGKRRSKKRNIAERERGA
jgi:hypothetical protein